MGSDAGEQDFSWTGNVTSFILLLSNTFPEPSFFFFSYGLRKSCFLLFCGHQAAQRWMCGTSYLFLGPYSMHVCVPPWPGIILFFPLLRVPHPLVFIYWASVCFCKSHQLFFRMKQTCLHSTIHPLKLHLEPPWGRWLLSNCWEPLEASGRLRKNPERPLTL